MNVISLYFALWVTVDHDGQDILYSTALSLSMLAVALSVPVFGALSDTTGKRRAPLIGLTLLCIFSTGLIGTTDHLWTGLILFMVANYGYQSALVFYNGMLPSISQGSHVGLVSGYGVALGYLGSIIGMLMVKPFVESGGRSSAFLPTAGLLLLFSLPCFLFVKDRETRSVPFFRIKEAFNTLKKTFLRARQYHTLFRFILIHFLVLDAVNTIIAFMSIYASKVIGFDDGQIIKFLISSTVGAMIGSLIIGILVKRKGTIWSYWLVLGLWIVSLSLAAVSQSESLFWLVGPIAGVGMGGVWVVSRAFIVELSPPEKVGEFFGLYGLAGKAASILGPMLWGGVVWALNTTGTLKYRVAVTVLLGIVIAAAFLFRGLTQRLKPQ
ncbi:MAG: MFS transporter [Nitrospina sp.]|nr:MFS transporter [Nitrospina sp.]MBT3509056.1 MFS transporter [Nitrospina sp.]MBT3876762.1 MFS transporter [Nitrospina sp.]MBT4047889.1 MFS transporter [Nitrospina sp.]MBT4558550.1 MFS transporter [Nitrospina sp.]